MASCKFEGGKYKSASEVKAHFRHNDIDPEKRAIAKKKNKDIDLTKCRYNFNILGLSYEERCKKYDNRIKYLDQNGNTNKRKDRVTAQCIEIPVPAGLPRDRYHDWFIRIADLLRKKYGKDNFIDADIHYDEEHEYRDPETMDLVVSRVHGHFMIVPEVHGKLNCKQITLRKNMKALNSEVDAMTQAEFGCSFMTGEKKKSTKKVEELKQASEYAELSCQIEQEKEDLIALQAALAAHKAALDNQAEELRAKEEMLYNIQNTLSEWRDNLEQREEAVRDLGEQKEALQQEREAVKQKEAQLDEAIKAVSQMPTLDKCVEKVLDVAFVKYTLPGSTATFDYVARRYLEHLQKEQGRQVKEICRAAGRTAPDYTFDTQQQPEDGMEF